MVWRAAGSSGRALAASGVIAALIHVNALLGVDPSVPVEAIHAEHATELRIEGIEVDALPAPKPPEAKPEERPAPEKVGAQTNEPSRDPPGVRPAREPKAEAAEKGPEGEGPLKPALPKPGAPDEYAPLPGRPAGGSLVYTLPGVLTPLAARPAATAPVAPLVDRQAANKALAGTLAKADAKLGLDLPGAGGVASAVRDAVQSSNLPADVKGTLEVRYDKSGKVASVRVGKVNGGDAGAWDKVAANAKASLGGKPLDVKGEPATIVVKIDSAMRFPSGSKTGIQVEPVCANDVLEQIAEILKGTSKLGDVAGPGRGIDANGVAPAAPVAGPSADALAKAEELKKKFCIPVGVKGAGDAADIGARATKVVSASYSVERDGVKKMPAAVLPIDTRPAWTPPDPTRVRPDVPGKKPWWQKKKGEK